ncbi:MAG: serine/threonine protein kinase [Myxococcales bacterium]|nr:serine/threonine protein kinase [Myxococcales bacterium]
MQIDENQNGAPPRSASPRKRPTEGTVDIRRHLEREPREPAQPSSGSIPTAVTTTRDALLLDEVLRTRLFAASALVVCVLTALVLLLMRGDPLAKNLHAAGLAIGAGGALWVVVRLRDAMAYGTTLNLVFACTTSVALVSCYVYWGVLSSAILVTPIVMYFFSVGQSFRPAIAVFVLACLSHLVLGVLISTGVIADRAVIRPMNVRVIEQLAMLGIAQLVFVVAFWLARGFRGTISKAIEQLQAAVRNTVRGKALLAEAEQELARALRIGGPGRFTEQSFGSYRLGNLIGRGAMGEVYEARHRSTTETAAVKLLTVGATGDPRIVRRFLRELTVAASIDSPNVVRVLEIADNEAPIPFLVMERLIGQSLADILRGMPRLPMRTIATMVSQVAAGVAAAHRAGIIHRDLKPRNLFRHAPGSGDEIWKILDFGVSKVTDQTGTLTEGYLVGTPAYMAPEQARGEAVDVRTDVYALGVIVYRALTGIPAFSGPDVPAILYAVAHTMPPRPTSMTPIPAAFDRVLAVALAKRPELRFESAQQFAAAVAAAIDDRVDAEVAFRADLVLRTTPWGRSS